MFTKSLKLFVVSTALIGSVGCGLKVNEDIPPGSEVNASLGMSTDCFAPAGTALNDFFKGTATEAQVHSFWNCLSFSVSEFEKNTHGKTVSLYTGRELANFFERYFLKGGRPISIVLMTEVFRLKRVFVGGNLESISRPEMAQAIRVMAALKNVTLKVNPHMKILNLNGKANLNNLAQSRADFVKAEQDLLTAVRELSALLKAEYSMDAFTTFANQLDPILPVPAVPETTMTEKANRYLPLLIAYKNVLFSDAGAVVGDAGRSWDNMLIMTAKIFARYAYYQYFVSGQTIENDDGAMSLKTFALESIDTLDQITAKKPGARFTTDELALLGNRLADAKLLPVEFTGPTIQQTLWLITNKFTTANLKTEINAWYSSQLSGAIRASLTDLAFDDSGRMSFMDQHRTATAKTMFKANLVNSLLRLVSKTYSATGSSAGLSDTEVSNLYLDFKPLMVAFKVVSATDVNFGLDRARDANLFTPQGNGDSFVSVKEGTDLVMMLMSGMKRDELLRQGLSQACAVTKTNQFWGDDTANNVCARNFYASKMAEELQFMPGFFSYMNVLNTVQRGNVTTLAFGAAGAVGTMPKFIKLANVPQILQYIEVLFTRFDLNRDGILNPTEANNAWPLFRQMMMKFSGQSGEDMNHAAFGYMLRHGSPPDDISEQLDFMANWRFKNPLSWSISADRARLLQVMGYIASLSPPEPAAVPSVCAACSSAPIPRETR
jgi:hypothetical protein